MIMNDETLTFYYYDDGLTRGEREQVARLLATDPVVAQRYQEICQQLDGLGELGESTNVSPPSDMVERWRIGLDRAISAEAVVAKKPVLHTGSFLWGAAITAVLAIGIGIGVFISTDSPTGLAGSGVLTASNPDSSAFIRGLKVHLRDTEQGLSMTPLEATADRSQVITTIIEQNRRYAKVAQKNDAQGLARVLRAFELTLVRLAADDITLEEAQALQTRLLFELKFVLTKLASSTSNQQLST
jgi:hypothetical protein